jgi:hypothetical protein
MSLAHVLHCAEECPDEVLDATILATFPAYGTCEDGAVAFRALDEQASWPVDDGESA